MDRNRKIRSQCLRVFVTRFILIFELKGKGHEPSRAEWTQLRLITSFHWLFGQKKINSGHSVCAHLWQDLCTNGVAGIQFFTLLFLPSHFYAYSGVKLQWFFRQSLTAQCVEISSFLVWRNDHRIWNYSLINLKNYLIFSSFHLGKRSTYLRMYICVSSVIELWV